MRDILFVPSFGNRPWNLVGREDVLKQFKTCMQSPAGSKERALLILGQRGSGKTVLLLEIKDIAEKLGYAAVSPSIVRQGMLIRIIEKLKEKYPKVDDEQKSTFTGESISALGFGAGIQLSDRQEKSKSPESQLISLCRKLNKLSKPVLFLIDEAQANNAELKRLVATYQEMVGEGLDVSLVMAGLPTAISSVLNDHVLTFLNRATRIILEPLRISDIAIYYKKAFSFLGITTDTEKNAEAAKVSAGSPYLMQLIGHYITITANDAGEISDAEFSEALNYAKAEFLNDVCRTSLEPLSEKDVELLKAMSEDESHSEISALSERMGVSQEYIQQYKRRLIQAGMIRQPRRGIICFAVPYLKDYLQSPLSEW